MNEGRVIRVVDGIVAVGWRAWTVQELKHGLRLCSVIYEAEWEPNEVAVASCENSHFAPSATCNCGFHAARDPVDAFSYLRGRDEQHTVGRVLGEVVLSGHLVETEIGWRAERGYPLRLYVKDENIADALAPYGIPILSTSCGSHSSPTCTETRLRSARSLPSWSVTSRI